MPFDGDLCAGSTFRKEQCRLFSQSLAHPFYHGPAATIDPLWGFSFAVSGMMMPPAVFSSAGAGFTITLSCNGVMLNFLAIAFGFNFK